MIPFAAIYMPNKRLPNMPVRYYLSRRLSRGMQLTSGMGQGQEERRDQLS